MTPDYYATLGLSPTSEDVVIRAAYRALIRRYHPDGNASAPAAARARAINAAYAVLSDPDKRAEYDEMRAAEAWPNAPLRRPCLPAPSRLFAAASVTVLLVLVFLVTWSPLPLVEAAGAHCPRARQCAASRPANPGSPAGGRTGRRGRFNPAGGGESAAGRTAPGTVAAATAPTACGAVTAADCSECAIAPAGGGAAALASGAS